MRSGAQIARLPWHADLERYIWRRASTTVWACSARSPLLSYRACHARCGARGAFQGSAGAAPAPSHPDHSVVGTVCEVWPHSRKTHRAVCWARAQQGVCTHMTRWEREGTAGHGGTRHFAAACWFAGTHDLRRGRRARFNTGAAAPALRRTGLRWRVGARTSHGGGALAGDVARFGRCRVTRAARGAQDSLACRLRAHAARGGSCALARGRHAVAAHGGSCALARQGAAVRRVPRRSVHMLPACARLATRRT